MSLLKDALARVTRAVRQMDPVPPRSHVFRPTSPPPAKKAGLERPKPPRKPAPKSARAQLRGFQKKRFQKFLEPLNMPSLKIYDDTLPPYDAARADANLRLRTSPNRTDVFTSFVNERFEFEKMMDFLVQLTPPHLMDAATIENAPSLAQVLREEDAHYNSTRVDNVPRYHFHEVPPMPENLTKDSFYRYIYFLTHSKVLYRNSSSLATGIVPEILLHTHNVQNTEFKPFRSTETYNCLIKYFGYDKFQSSFARELLLVMAQDGHKPNLNTIHQLLKICRIHSRRRGVVSTYKVVTNYLRLAKQLDLQVNVATWNRVYDCIGNIFLKETFLNKMTVVHLPIPHNFCIRILEDFSKTTKSTAELVTFLEQDLRKPAWRTDPRLAEKVLYHRILHAKHNSGLEEAFCTFLPSVSVDPISLKTTANALCANPGLQHKPQLVLCSYLQLQERVQVVPAEVFGKLIETWCENAENYDLGVVNLVVRGLVHVDAVEMLRLPVDRVKQVKSFKSEKNKLHKSEISDKGPYQKFPFTIPKQHLSEHYRIMKRLTRDSLNRLEASVVHANNTYAAELPMPWEPLTKEEMTQWVQLKAHFAELPFWNDISNNGPVTPSAHPQTPAWIVDSYIRQNSISKGLTRDASLIERLQVGLEKHTVDEMQQRGIRKA